MNKKVIKLNSRRQVIGIDARFYGPLGKGLGRYVQEIVDNLIKINEAKGGEFDYVIFLSRANFNEFNSSSSRVRKELVDLTWYSWQEQFFFPKIIRQAKIDLMHFPHFNVAIFCPTPFIVTIHDLILTRFPSRRATMLPATLYWLKQAAYRLVIRTALKKSQKIITVSNFTKNDIIKQFKVEPEKIVVSYEGVAKLSESNLDSSKEDDVRILDRYGVKKPYILYVGNAYPHKNLESLLPVFQELSLSHPELSLVLVGKEDFFYQRLRVRAEEIDQKLKRKNPLFHFPGFVPDQDLAHLYQNALCYIFPSLYEGFGLPPLEAMSFSCPVLSSDQASLPEIMGDAALYYNPYQENDLSEKLKLIMSDDILRTQLISAGILRVKLFSWLDCAEKTREVYKTALS